MTSGRSFANSKWFRDVIDRSDWRQHAECARRPDLPWTEDVRPNVAQAAVMETLCEGCPALLECAEYALKSSNGAGVDGGWYAGVWIPWKTAKDHYQDRGMRAFARTTLRRLLRRHRGSLLDISDI